ncbi:MAG TPA: hydrogenase expression/formation protein HypE [Phycisphaerales bacterium]|nr:hydrogenase expression/formation protein HypE [Phycisphaerales bacterium]
MTDEQKKTVLLAHGGGGRLTSDLIEKTILSRFKNDTLGQLTDAACIDTGSSQILFTTDSFVVKPLFFNGGDIGKLAICGTVNDLAVSGADPKALSLSLIIEEGLPMETLETILSSAAATAEKAGVPVVTGDTKVVERSAADGIFINTAGIGTKMANVNLSFDRIAPGDKIIINGTIGDHGMTIMSQREGIKFDSPTKSDCACLNDLVATVLKASPNAIKFMRDPTRGGVAATLNEVASSTGLNIELIENALPIDTTVRAAADMLGFDLLDIANEGKVIMVVASEAAEDILQACKAHPLGEASAVIGTVLEADESAAAVEIVTAIGGRRVVQMPYGRELPRIC